MYPEMMVIPMREELVRAGINETRTAEEVDAALAEPGTTLSSSTPSAVARPAKCAPACVWRCPTPPTSPIARSPSSPARIARPPSAPAATSRAIRPARPPVAIMRDGKLVYLMQRFVIEQSTAQDIAAELVRAFDECLRQDHRIERSCQTFRIGPG